eukprot:3025812-Rhodomonas_salina.1
MFKARNSPHVCLGSTLSPFSPILPVTGPHLFLGSWYATPPTVLSSSLWSPFASQGSWPHPDSHLGVAGALPPLTVPDSRLRVAGVRLVAHGP